MSRGSSSTTMLTSEASDSDSGNLCPFRTKRPKHEGNFSASRFKGAVEQWNGHWGAQIYVNNKRIWIGTFESEIEAAMAYDSAAMKLGRGYSRRNFPRTKINSQEKNFQSQFRSEAVLDMIRDGSYPSKFVNYLRLQLDVGKIDIHCNLVPVQSNGADSCRELFQKKLTPSDVGKFHRLVIPKSCALRYFPSFPDGADDMEVVFHDKSMIKWKFRYCHWKSSESFVLTRGWNKFVKEKELKPKDVDGKVKETSEDEGTAFHQLDSESNVDDGKVEDEFGEKAQLLYGGENVRENQDSKEHEGIEFVDAQRKCFRLFGVQIIEIARVRVRGGSIREERETACNMHVVDDELWQAGVGEEEQVYTEVHGVLCDGRVRLTKRCIDDDMSLVYETLCKLTHISQNSHRFRLN
ncbi:hypothetical protein RJ639_047211 [Escallonia herrerae]|uniref:AP2/ERF and B3 domain-containing transcription factor n=1 Tax=Escallonia herrerae TaxID=1293975 RepID=A0AA88W7T0_9ASTE|nr:hypothetical protein RJ639_047211 [Escallonia herrerae]